MAVMKPTYGPGFCGCRTFRRSDCRAGSECGGLLEDLAGNTSPRWVTTRLIAAAACAGLVAFGLLAMVGCAHVGPPEPRTDGVVCRPVSKFPWLWVDRFECRGLVR